MWDQAFDPEDYASFSDAIKNSTTLRCIISTKTREFWKKWDVPLDLSQPEKKVSLLAMGGHCSSVLFIHNLLRFEASHEDLMASDPSISPSYFMLSDAIDKASDFQMRETSAKDANQSWNEEAKRRTKLYHLLDKETFQQSKYFSTYYSNSVLTRFVDPLIPSTRKYWFYRCQTTDGQKHYRPIMAKHSTIELNAVKSTSGMVAIIVPSYCSTTRKIAVGLQYYFTKGNNKVVVTTYSIDNCMFDEITFSDAVSQFHFDHNIELPLTMQEYRTVLEGYHKKHPAAHSCDTSQACRTDEEPQVISAETAKRSRQPPVKLVRHYDLMI
jgi:hypothetical protein